MLPQSTKTPVKFTRAMSLPTDINTAPVVIRNLVSMTSMFIDGTLSKKAVVASTTELSSLSDIDEDAPLNSDTEPNEK